MNLICKHCNNTKDFYEKPRPDTPHDAEIRCSVCNKFIMWKPKDRNKDKRPPNKILPVDLGIDYCEICLRVKARLGRNETLTSHHKIEIAMGGLDVKENILILCTHCHNLVHHVRLYMNDHFGDLWEKYEEMKLAIEQKDLTPEEYEGKIIENLEDLEKPPWEE